MSTDTLEQTEKRSLRRARVLKGAKIAFSGLSVTRDCIIRDISETGARLNFETSVGIPPVFHLLLDGAPMRVCRVVWCRSHQIGVEFIPENGSGAGVRLKKSLIM